MTQPMYAIEEDTREKGSMRNVQNELGDGCDSRWPPRDANIPSLRLS